MRAANHFPGGLFNQLVEIPSTVSVFCLTGFGAATGAKVVQSFGEKPPAA